MKITLDTSNPADAPYIALLFPDGLNLSTPAERRAEPVSPQPQVAAAPKPLPPEIATATAAPKRGRGRPAKNAAPAHDASAPIPPPGGAYSPPQSGAVADPGKATGNGATAAPPPTDFGLDLGEPDSKHTINDVKAAMRGYYEKFGRDATLDLLKRFGGPSATQVDHIKPESWGLAIKAAQQSVQ